MNEGNSESSKRKSFFDYTGLTFVCAVIFFFIAVSGLISGDSIIQVSGDPRFEYRYRNIEGTENTLHSILYLVFSGLCLYYSRRVKSKE